MLRHSALDLGLLLVGQLEVVVGLRNAFHKVVARVSSRSSGGSCIA